MPDNKCKYTCPRCGKDNYSIQNKGGSKTTFLHCKGCGYNGAEKGWQAQQEDLYASKNPFYKKSASLTHFGQYAQQPQSQQQSEQYFAKFIYYLNQNIPNNLSQEIQGNIKYDSEIFQDGSIGLKITLSNTQIPAEKEFQISGDENSDFSVIQEIIGWLQSNYPDNPEQQNFINISKNNQFYKKSQATSVGDDQRPASDKTKGTEGDPEIPKRNLMKKPRKNPERAFSKADPEEVRRVSMKNPFYKKAGIEVTDENYFDAAQALYWICANHHTGQNSVMYSILSTLEYNPSPMESGVNGEESFEAKEIYDALEQLCEKDYEKCERVCVKLKEDIKRVYNEVHEREASANTFYKKAKEDPCWDKYEQIGTKKKNGKEVPNCVPKKKKSSTFGKIKKEAAEYQGKKVELNKPMRGDVKKYKVYVKNDKGNVVKVNFGDKDMEIKRDDPERRKSFRARHNCDDPGPKTKARYWSCKMWSNTPVSDILSNNFSFYKKSEKDNMKGNKGPDGLNKSKNKDIEGPKGEKGDKGMKGPKKANTNPFYKASGGTVYDIGMGVFTPRGTSEFTHPKKNKMITHLVKQFSDGKIDEDKLIEGIRYQCTSTTRYCDENDAKEILKKYFGIEIEDQLDGYEEVSIEMTNEKDFSMASRNPFYKTAKDTKCSHCGCLCEGDICDSCEKKKEASKNPFYKGAREFKPFRSEHGQVMKDIANDNMEYPESRPEDLNKKKKKDQTDNVAAEDSTYLADNDSFTKESKRKKGHEEESSTLAPYDFSPTDRKEYRSSPDPRKFEPGYQDWHNREVDPYYDGWLDDHIENSGGSVPGSNEQKTMNLDEGEREHAPAYPTEAIYERLLESRHEFNEDYEWIVANNVKYLIKKSDVQDILNKSQVKSASDDSKKKNLKEKTINVRSPYSPDVEEGEERRLYNGGEENELYFDPETGKVYHTHGNAYNQQQPVWKTKKVKVKE